MFKRIIAVMARPSYVRGLEADNYGLVKTVDALERRIQALEGQAFTRDAAIGQVRAVAERLRERIRSHGMTDPEKEFLASVVEIIDNGNKVSHARCKAAVKAMKEARDIPDWKEWG